MTSNCSRIHTNMRPSDLLHKNRDNILAILNKYPMISNIRVFGSIARGEDTRESDLDILIDITPETTLFDLGGFSEDLHDILDIKVDIITSNDRMSTVMHEHIFNEAIPI